MAKKESAERHGLKGISQVAGSVVAQGRIELPTRGFSEDSDPEQ